MEVPISIVKSATAASYTVPADRYAIVRAGVHRGGTLSIDGVAVMFSEDFSWNTLASANSPLTVTEASAGNAMNTANGNNSSTGTVGAMFTNGTARAFSSQHATTFKVPPGTVIVGSGTARYLIELYKVPGSAT